MATANRQITIEPVTRVEGHGKVTIQLDEAGQVTDARLHIVEFRGFERFIQGRPYWEVPVLVQRLCGICPVSHHLAAAKAMDGIVGAETLTPTAEKIRRLMHYGQTFQSHALHFFHLASPDLLFGFDAPAAKRNVIAVAAEHKDLAVQGVMMRKYGQEIIKATAGKRIHGTGAVPGGVNKNLSVAERDVFLAEIEQMLAWTQGARLHRVQRRGQLRHLGHARRRHGCQLRDGDVLANRGLQHRSNGGRKRLGRHQVSLLGELFDGTGQSTSHQEGAAERANDGHCEQDQVPRPVGLGRRDQLVAAGLHGLDGCITGIERVGVALVAGYVHHTH